MSFWSKVGAWFKGFFTARNMEQVAKVAADVGAVAASAATKNIPGGLEAGAQLVSDAKAIKVEGPFAWNASSISTSVPTTTSSTASN